jgi:hypothetical protein
VIQCPALAGIPRISETWAQNGRKPLADTNWDTAITAGTSRVVYGPQCLHAVANTPAGLIELVRSYHPINFGLPRNRGGSAPALVVSRPARRVPLATFCTRGFSSFVASTTTLIATGWSEPVSGSNSRCGPSPFTAHAVTPFTGTYILGAQEPLASPCNMLEFRKMSLTVAAQSLNERRCA